jgi:hypothetical protein
VRDLDEVRRFWPRATQQGLRRWVPLSGGTGLEIVFRRGSDTWSVKDWRHGRVKTRNGDTIAAAMAAAGFGKRKPGPYAMHNRGMAGVARAWQKGPWKGYDRVPHVTRQRPRKRARLGGKARRLACWMAIYRDSSLVTAAQVRASY